MEIDNDFLKWMMKYAKFRVFKNEEDILGHGGMSMLTSMEDSIYEYTRLTFTIPMFVPNPWGGGMVIKNQEMWVVN